MCVCWAHFTCIPEWQRWGWLRPHTTIIRGSPSLGVVVVEISSNKIIDSTFALPPPLARHGDGGGLPTPLGDFMRKAGNFGSIKTLMTWRPPPSRTGTQAISMARVVHEHKRRGRMKYPWQDSGHAVKFVANYVRTPPATPREQAAKYHRDSSYGSAATAAPPSAATPKTRRARSV